MAGLVHKSSKSPEKCSNVALTCNLLSQYLKKGGSFGDISLGIKEAKGSETTRPPATTMNLFPKEENSGEMMGKINGAVTSANPISLDILPQFTTFGSPNINEETSKADLRRSAPIGPEAAQMTIFYGGQVIVFDDFPADKAKEIMDLANKASSGGSNCFLPTSTFEKIDLNNPVTSDSSNFKFQLQPQASASSDLPIARRASLLRFLEKRKERVAIRGPYQINKPSDLSPSRSQESSPWIELEALSSRHLELRL